MKVSQNINFTKTKTRRCINNDIVFSPLKQSTTEKKVYRALNAQQQFMNGKELKLSNFLSVCFKVKIALSRVLVFKSRWNMFLAIGFYYSVDIWVVVTN